MKPGDVRVLAAGMKVVADDTETAIRVLRLAENAVPAALGGLADDLGESVLVIPELEVKLGIYLSEASLFPAALRDTLRAAYGTEVRKTQLRAHAANHAAAGDASAVVSSAAEDQPAWYPSLAAALGDYLHCLQDGRVTRWPQRVFSGHGHDWSTVFRTCLRDGRVLPGDVLAEVARRGLVPALLRKLEAPVGMALLACWEGPDHSTTATTWAAFPSDVRDQVMAHVLHDLQDAGFLVHSPDTDNRTPPASPDRQANGPGLADSPDIPANVSSADLPRTLRDAGVLPSGSSASTWPNSATPRYAWANGASRDHATLAVLAHLFSSWPPARGLRFAANELAAAVEAALSPQASPRASAQPGSQKKLLSQAGGLVFWATVLKEIGIDGSLAEGYRQRRLRNAVRFAVARGLESASLSARDPLLLVWSGEEPDVAAFPLQALIGADPEPLHRLAIQTAATLGFLATPLHVVRFGNWHVALGAHGMVIDALVRDGADAHDAVPTIVQRLIRRGAAAPPGINVDDRLSTDDLDSIGDIDVPALPDAWRPAVWALVSVVRAAATSRWRTKLADVRGWPAVVLGNGHIELPRLRIEGVAAGTWLRSPVRLGEQDWTIVVP